MSTQVYFEKDVKDQDEDEAISVEFGRSSYYAGCDLKNGKTGEDSIYLNVDDKSVLMDIETAREFVNAAAAVGRYFGILEE